MGRRGLSALGAAVAVIAVAACSSSSSGGSSGTPSTSPSASTSSSSASGPIHIGFANMNTGANSFPAVTQAAQAATKYLNQTQGGLDGRQIDLVTCDLQNSNQAAQECGQQFANDKQMPFAMLGLTLNGGPFYAAMNAAHKPILGALGITPADNSPKDTYFYYPGATYYNYIANYVKSLHIHSISYIDEGEAASLAGEQTVAKGLKGSGITIHTATIPVSASDVTPQVESADIKSTDALLVFTTGTCPQVAQAMQSLGIKAKRVLVVNTCVTPANVAASPSLYQGWTLVAPNRMSAIGPGIDPEVTAFLNGFKKYGPRARLARSPNSAGV